MSADRISGVTSNRLIGTALLAASLIVVRATAAVEVATEGHGTDSAIESTTNLERDPFWPVGYMPETMQTADSTSSTQIAKPAGGIDWMKAMEKVSIQGVSSRAGNEFYAVINGQVYSRGESVAVQHGSTIYTWVIEDISPPSSVKMRRMKAE